MYIVDKIDFMLMNENMKIIYSCRSCGDKKCKDRLPNGKPENCSLPQSKTVSMK